MRVERPVVVMNEGKVIATGPPGRGARGRPGRRRLPRHARGARERAPPPSSRSTARGRLRRGARSCTASRSRAGRRARLGDRPERRRQVDAAEGGLRAGPRPRGGTRARCDGAERDVTALAPHRLTRRGLNYVPQLDNVFPSLSVAENLEVGAVLRAARASRRARSTASTSSSRCCASGAASAPARSPAASGSCSRSRARSSPSPRAAPARRALGRARAAGGRRASSRSSREISELGIAIVMVEQNARRALALRDYGYVLDMGRNRFEGTGAELLRDAKVAELYLGGAAGSRRRGRSWLPARTTRSSARRARARRRR